MDDHMLDRLRAEIELCFMCATDYSKDGEYLTAAGGEVKAIDTMDYKAATILISTYNELVKMYYKKEFVKENLYKSVAVEYKKYLKEGKK